MLALPRPSRCAAVLSAGLLSLLPLIGSAVPAGAETTTEATYLAKTTATPVAQAYGRCQDLRVPVSAAASTLTVAGTLCTPRRWARGARTVDVLVHGGMYNRKYWDWPLQPERYSYVARTLAAGRATLTYDRFGAGDSDRPYSLRASFASDVDALHGLVQWLRPQYGQVHVVGHSLGSVVAIHEAGAFRDVDRLVITGLTHGHGLGFLTLPVRLLPAILDQQFQGRTGPLDVGYLTTLPGQRGPLFYSSSADPAVIASDEANKDVMTDAQTVGAITSLTLPPPLNIADQITAPVLLIVGKKDLPFCNVDVDCTDDARLRAHELPYFARSAGLTTRTVPDTGHDLALHPSAGQSFAAISGWMAGS
jgi:pimeloyl-ACP methyl ester carboxylesterase